MGELFEGTTPKTYTVFLITGPRSQSRLGVVEACNPDAAKTKVFKRHINRQRRKVPADARKYFEYFKPQLQRLVAVEGRLNKLSPGVVS